MFAFVLLPALLVFVLAEPDEPAPDELPLLDEPDELPLPDELPPLDEPPELLPPPELPPELLLPELLPPPEPLLLPPDPPELPLDLLLIFTVFLMPSTHLPVAST